MFKIKKVISIFLVILLSLYISGCAGEKKTFTQEITMVTMPSPPKCKTTHNISTINKILSLFADVPKAPLEEKENGWFYKIILNVDGNIFTYTVSESVFTDSDGSQYAIDGEEMMETLGKIYAEITTAETDYTEK